MDTWFGYFTPSIFKYILNEITSTYIHIYILDYLCRKIDKKIGKFPISIIKFFLYYSIVSECLYIIFLKIKIGKANGAPPVSGSSGFDSHPEIF